MMFFTEKGRLARLKKRLSVAEDADERKRLLTNYLLTAGNRLGRYYGWQNIANLQFRISNEVYAVINTEGLRQCFVTQIDLLVEALRSGNARHIKFAQNRAVAFASVFRIGGELVDHAVELAHRCNAFPAALSFEFADELTRATRSTSSEQARKQGSCLTTEELEAFRSKLLACEEPGAFADACRVAGYLQHAWNGAGRRTAA